MNFYSFRVRLTDCKRNAVVFLWTDSKLTQSKLKSIFYFSAIVKKTEINRLLRFEAIEK